MEVRHVGIAAGGDMIDTGALGDDQANPAGSPAPVIVDHIGPGNIPRGFVAGHGRHHQAVGELQFAEAERLEQDVGITHCIFLLR